MAKYRILLLIEEDSGESVGDELVDYTETIGWANDLDAAGDYVAMTRDLACAIVEKHPGVALDGDWDHELDPNWFENTDDLDISDEDL